MGRKATGLCSDEVGIWQQGCQAILTSPYVDIREAIDKTAYGDTAMKKLSPVTSGHVTLHFFVAVICLVTCIFIISVSVREAQAADITLAWDQNPETDIEGYRVYVGSYSSDRTMAIDIGNYTTCVIGDLEPGKTYFFAATAYNTAGLESDFSDEITATVSAANQAPIADAGPGQTVTEGVLVTLNGLNSSDPDGEITSYEWTQISGPFIPLSDPSAATPSFTAPDTDVEGMTLSFRLTVTDAGGLQSTDTCIVNITWQNEAPQADAGPDQTISELTAITLNGLASSDPDDGIASYHWIQLSGPYVTLSSTTSALTSFTTPDAGSDGTTLTFQLTVTDGCGLQSSDTCIVNVTCTATPPVAEAGLDQTVNERTTTTLNGLASFDPDGQIVGYRWSQTSGRSVVLSVPLSACPTFTAPSVQKKGTVLTFELIITDSDGLQARDACTVYVNDVRVPPGLIDKNPKIK